jgi:hypothetical protein
MISLERNTTTKRREEDALMYKVQYSLLLFTDLFSILGWLPSQDTRRWFSFTVVNHVKVKHHGEAFWDNTVARWHLHRRF